MVDEAIQHFIFIEKNTTCKVLCKPIMLSSVGVLSRMLEIEKKIGSNIHTEANKCGPTLDRILKLFTTKRKCLEEFQNMIQSGSTFIHFKVI